MLSIRHILVYGPQQRLDHPPNFTLWNLKSRTPQQFWSGFSHFQSDLLSAPFTCFIFGAGTDDLISIDVAPLTWLRSIEFTVHDGTDPTGWITETLLRVSSAHLEDVTFKFEYCTPEQPDDISGCLEWRHVDAILQQSTFSRLKKVLVWLVYQVEHINAIERLPLCAARGILRVDH